MIGVAMAGRDTPRMRPIRSSDAAMAAPVLPALTMAEARPSRTASAARTTEESFIFRTLAAASAPMAITSEAGTTSKSPTSSSILGLAHQQNGNALLQRPGGHQQAPIGGHRHPP